MERISSLWEKPSEKNQGSVICGEYIQRHRIPIRYDGDRGHCLYVNETFYIWIFYLADEIHSGGFFGIYSSQIQVCQDIVSPEWKRQMNLQQVRQQC